MPQNAKATLASRTPPPIDFIPDSGDSGGGDFISDGGGTAASNPTQFEQQRSPGAQRGLVGTLGDRIGSGISSIGKGIKDAWNNIGNTQPPSMDELKANTSGPGRLVSEVKRQATRPLPPDLNNPMYRAATTLSPLTPVNPERMEQQSDTGDTGGIAADALLATGQTVSPSLAGRIPGASGALRERVGSFLHDARTGEAMSPYKAAVEKLAPEPTARVADRAQGQASNLNARMNLKAQGEANAEAAKTDAANRQPVPISEGPTAPRHAAVRGAQADVARRNARQFVPTGDAPSSPSGIGVPGSPQQEAGYQAPVLKIPEPKGKQPRVTPEQVPGPDTAGKGNLLTPGAKRGVEGFGDEHVRRGRPVLYTQEQYPGRRLEGTLADRLGQSSPTLSQRIGGNGAGGNGGGNGYKPTEKASTMSGERRNLGPEFDAQQREEMIGRYKGILRHPDATPTDIAEATARLKELGATQ